MAGKQKGADAVKSKSPAEFFAENQNIAGFDNAGKALYTTVRELVENSLDAAEAVNVLPEIVVTIEEMSKTSFNSMRGLGERERVDHELYDKGGKSKSKAKLKKIDSTESTISVDASPPASQTLSTNGKKEKAPRETTYYRVTCKDNGAGMPHDKIPDMLGRVLSSAKYGVKQTRGKFGLGAKMALIWSKKSTGLPIEIQSSQDGRFKSQITLDIDIYKNEPRVIRSTKESNKEGWRGSEISVIIEGNWKSYGSKVLKYMSQLAVITPYAQFDFQFKSSITDKTFTIRYKRRSDAMPPTPAEVKYHPSSVNNLLVRQLIDSTKSLPLNRFLSKELSCISLDMADRLIAELGPSFEDIESKQLTEKQVHQLTQLLREANFPPIDGECLSPAGEYNLRLGIIKELRPDMVATFQEPASSYEGHPFIVEAGVSLGGKGVKPGINVYRFSNRIPLLFEAGADVVTRVANKKINWASYKIKPTSDKIGVFVSIVSTKIPFKGTGKEYIGDDITEIQTAVRHAIAQCCLQLKVKLARQLALDDRKKRKGVLKQYIPDVSRSIFNVLNQLSEERVAKRQKLSVSEFSVEQINELTDHHLLELIQARKITQELFANQLLTHVEQVDAESALEFMASSGLQLSGRESLYLCPYDGNNPALEEVHHPLGIFHLLKA
eukprot:GILK01008563.1.p1 GENE.GILK01008563.1~~GILK01008563.1.p1  ORF type:complete len:674 (-),score=141.04 GILK01008563.1:230-2227(-)